jgi:predicted DNA-binding transcriptional regulator YafY
MPTPAVRLLAFLEILQSRPFVTGTELAAELGVDVRTVRRYAAAVQELGFPVDGERGPRAATACGRATSCRR